jgi:hypothetical protein
MHLISRYKFLYYARVLPFVKQNFPLGDASPRIKERIVNFRNLTLESADP